MTVCDSSGHTYLPCGGHDNQIICICQKCGYVIYVPTKKPEPEKREF